MTADILNLNKARKAKARQEKKKLAEENRAKFGRTKEQKRETGDEDARRNALLDGAKRDRAEDSGETDPDPGTVS